MTAWWVKIPPPPLLPPPPLPRTPLLPPCLSRYWEPHPAGQPDLSPKAWALSLPYNPPLDLRTLGPYILFLQDAATTPLIFLFPIKTRLSTGQIYWYLIILYKNTDKISTFEVWDTFWDTCSKREKEWDKALIRYMFFLFLSSRYIL